MESRRVALVTGAGRGIGSAVARRLAEDGLSLAVNDVDEENARQVVGELLDMGFDAVPVVGSVAVPESADHVIEMTRKKFGRLDVLVNNAGATRPAYLEANDATGRQSTFRTVSDLKRRSWSGSSTTPASRRTAHHPAQLCRVGGHPLKGPTG